MESWPGRAGAPGRVAEAAAPSVLTFAGGLPPLTLDGAELRAHRSGTTTLAGWARPGTPVPRGELCLPLAEHAGRRWAVADVRVGVVSTGCAWDRVEVGWQGGHELEAVDPYGRYRVEVAWLLRARTLKLLALDDLIDRVVGHAVTVAFGSRDPEEARRLEFTCNELTSRDPLVVPRRPRRSAEAGPLRLRHDVVAAGGHLATTTGTVRARAESADRLASLSLATFPRRMPAAPDAPVLVVNSLSPTLGVLRACESVAAGERARALARTGAAEEAAAAAAAAEAGFDAACEALRRHYTRPIPYRRRPASDLR